MMLAEKTPSISMKISLRDAIRQDCAEIAKLFLISSDGLAEYIWGKSAGPGEDILAVGERRYAREDVDFSWQNCRMVEVDGRVAGMLLAYEIPFQSDGDASSESVADPVLKPYSELEIPGSYYVSGVAIHARYRGLGLGKLLMLDAHDRAISKNLGAVTLICFEENVRAMHMYRQRGYREQDRRSIVPHRCLHYTEGDAILLAC